jgi:DNA-binding HxlR family transcriptional regulator
VAASPKKRRSGCPVNLGVERFGDRWSLLIVRDLMVRGLHTFREFRDSGEGIATNVLASRLKKLEAGGIVSAEADARDRRQVNYRLTEKGIDLAPVLLELFVWAARHEQSDVPCEWIGMMEYDRERVLAEVRRRWEARDLTPLLPNREKPGKERGKR